MRCCIVTPVGPGHENHYLECKNSVLSAFRSNPGPFSDLVFAGMDDSQGIHGRSKRRNDGIEFAIDQRADWIFFIDADDLMTKSAFAALNGVYETHDAVWGAILEQPPGQQPGLRPNQAMKLSSLCELLDNDPTLTVQMGHFVRSNTARQIRFDTSMDTGEDFKYYLQLWRDYRCIKLPTPLFLNRRGVD